MKNIIAFVMILALLPMTMMGQGIKFEKGTFQEALAKTKKEDKLLFIDGYAVWCGPCKKMDKTVFQEAVVGDFFKKHMIALKVDVERGEGPELKKKYNIIGLPGYVILNGDDEVIYRFSSAMTTEKFMEHLETALAMKDDPIQVRRLAQLYRENKDDEPLVREYLDELLRSKASRYTDVLEHYLRMQTTMEEESKEMVLFLAAHLDQVIIGGMAANIIDNNMKTPVWRQYVRKGIRAEFQKLPKSMIQRTTDYAVEKRDTTYLERAIMEADNRGLISDMADQRKRLYTYYFKGTGQGERYKAMVKDDLYAFMNGIDKEDLREGYMKIQAEIEGGDLMAKSKIPFSVRVSQQIMAQVKDFAKFATTPEEQAQVIEWMQVADYILPGDAVIMSELANVIYKFGDKNKAVALKNSALKIAEEKSPKYVAGIKQSLEVMRSGGEITI